MSNMFKNVSKEDKKMLNSIFWRSFAVFACPMPAYRQAPGFTFSVAPALDRYYPEQEKRAEAMQRHMTPYNITQAVGTFAMGLAASMEKENAANYGEYDVSSIPAIKTSLMGPLSGIGDALFWGIVRTISASVGISLAATGSIMGPILFLVLYNIPNIVCRYFMTYLGYTLGETFLKEAYQSGFVSILTKVAVIVGMTMVGFMITSTVRVSLALSMTLPGAESAIAVQSYLDQIMYGIVPIGVTFICYYLLNKGMNTNRLILLVSAVGFVLGFFGILG